MSLALLLRCHDLDETRRFYESVLGFSVGASAGNTLTAELDGDKLLFTAQDLWRAGPALSGTIYFTVPDVDGLYASLQNRAEIAWPLQEMPYGSREFALSDCNGYLLAFQQQR